MAAETTPLPPAPPDTTATGADTAAAVSVFGLAWAAGAAGLAWATGAAGFAAAWATGAAGRACATGAAGFAWASVVCAAGRWAAATLVVWRLAAGAAATDGAGTDATPGPPPASE